MGSPAKTALVPNRNQSVSPHVLIFFSKCCSWLLLRSLYFTNRFLHLLFFYAAMRDSWRISMASSYFSKYFLRPKFYSLEVFFLSLTFILKKTLLIFRFTNPENQNAAIHICFVIVRDSSDVLTPGTSTVFTATCSF